MTRLSLVFGVLGVFGVALVAGCGGTGAETPWPVEPDDVDLAPAGETDLTKPSGDARNPRRPGPGPALQSTPAAVPTHKR